MACGVQARCQHEILLAWKRAFSLTAAVESIITRQHHDDLYPKRFKFKRTAVALTVTFMFVWLLLGAVL